MTRTPTLDETDKVYQKHLPTHLDPNAMAAAQQASRDRGNHQGTQVAATISDLPKAVRDLMAATLIAGTNMTFSVNATTGRITLNATGGGGTGTGVTDPEIVRDVIGGALLSGPGILVEVDDATDLIKISAVAGAGATDAELRNRTTHTGEQPQSTITGLVAALAARLTSVPNAKSQWAYTYSNPAVDRPTPRTDVSITWVAVGTTEPPVNGITGDTNYVADTP